MLVIVPVMSACSSCAHSHPRWANAPGFKTGKAKPWVVAAAPKLVFCGLLVNRQQHTGLAANPEQQPRISS